MGKNKNVWHVCTCVHVGIGPRPALDKKGKGVFSHVSVFSSTFSFFLFFRLLATGTGTGSFFLLVHTIIISHECTAAQQKQFNPLCRQLPDTPPIPL